jgi:hypothetical protein
MSKGQVNNLSFFILWYNIDIIQNGDVNMATLSGANLDAVWIEVMRKYSNLRTEVPVNKNKLKTGMQQIDSLLEASELTIFQGILDADVKSWLQSNQSVGRDIIVMIEQKRRDTL